MTTESARDVAVRRSVLVPLPPDRAFALFTVRMAAFWPPSHSIGDVPIADVVIEPREGGRWFERGVDGSECDWGRIAAWDPPNTVVLLWQLGVGWRLDPDLETEVEVTFSATRTGETEVELVHHHLERFGDATESMRSVFEATDGWESILAGFAAVADGDRS